MGHSPWGHKSQTGVSTFSLVLLKEVSVPATQGVRGE